MKKILNKRLMEISAFIEKKDKVIDIGCDHGLLGIYLAKEKGNKRIISSDINEKPLKKALENICEYELSNVITIKLADGLDGLEKDIDTIVISGMGGLTMVDILQKINNYPQVMKIILSPNSDFDIIRNKITKLGFMIEYEKIVKENNKYYLIIKFIKGNKKVDSFFGKLDLKDEIVCEYYQKMYYKNKTIISKMPFKEWKKKIKLLIINKRIKRHINFY